MQNFSKWSWYFWQIFNLVWSPYSLIPKGNWHAIHAIRGNTLFCIFNSPKLLYFWWFECKPFWIKKMNHQKRNFNWTTFSNQLPSFTWIAFCWVSDVKLTFYQSGGNHLGFKMADYQIIKKCLNFWINLKNMLSIIRLYMHCIPRAKVSPVTSAYRERCLAPHKAQILIAINGRYTVTHAPMAWCTWLQGWK